MRGGALLPADEQEVIWIDGLSIELNQLSPELEPVGICVAINGRKAIVKYKEEIANVRWSASERWELTDSSIMNDNNEHILTITLNGIEYTNKPFTFKAEFRKDFVKQLNDWFLTNDTNYSAELVELDADKPANDTSDTKDGDSYRNRIIVNAKFTSGSWNTVGINGITIKRAIGKHVKTVNFYYINNGFTRIYEGGCCRAKYYDYYSLRGTTQLSPLTSINTQIPVKLIDFTDNDNCKILRENFATYYKYIDSLIIKYPCGAGGTITEFPSGKENTYKLANCTFYDNSKTEENKNSILYPVANKVASIDVRGPKLTNGNWWLPSVAEMVQIMRDITYGTSFEKTNKDIVNRVIDKIRSVDTKWTYLSTSTTRWTSSKYGQNGAYYYSGSNSGLNFNGFFSEYAVFPITIYEF